MRLVCPNCVAQYEVADGTIPESGRDVQCANCGHIWFQDAAFKLSTDDLTYVPQRFRATDADEDDDDGDDAPGMFHSQRAGRSGGAPAETAERALPEVGNNVLDILRSEAAFSSRRRAEGRAEQTASRPEQEQPDHHAPDGAEDTSALLRRIGTRAEDIAPPEIAAEAEPDQTEPQAGDAIGAPDADSGKTAWRHFVADRTEDTADDAADADTDDAVADSGFGGDATLKAGDQMDTADEPEYDEDLDDDLTGLAADEAKRIADAAVARSAPEQADPPLSAEEHRDDVRKAIRRIAVRNLAVPTASPDAEETDPPRGSRPEPAAAEDRYGDETFDDEVGAFEEAVAAFDDKNADAEGAAMFDMADSAREDSAGAGPGSGSETFADTYLDPDIREEYPATEAEPGPETAPEPEEEAAPPAAVTDPDDIRHVRRSLVENRKVLLPDVEELNTSLRMDKPEARVDLRSSAFSDEDIANRNKFWLGLVTALMLFGIFSALYLMGPAISDVFPAADPYVAEYRHFVDKSLDVTAKALVPLVDWLEAL